MIRRKYVNPGMLAAIMIPLLIYGVSMIDVGLFPPGKSDMDVLSAYAEPVAMSNYLQFACVFPALPYAFSYLEEKNSGYVKFIYSRMGRKKYLFRKVVSVGMSGGIAAAVPNAILFLYLILTQHAVSTDVNSAYYPALMEGMSWMHITGIWGGKYVLLLKLILTFLFGVFWAEFTLMISMLISNRYIVFAVPITLYLVTWMVVPTRFSMITPIYLLRGDFDERYFIFMPFVVQLIYITAIICLSIIIFRRRQEI